MATTFVDEKLIVSAVNPEFQNLPGRKSHQRVLKTKSAVL
jgi:hypothetical protein